jgi:type II secretory pathway pseudopilin PulG
MKLATRKSSDKWQVTSDERRKRKAVSRHSSLVTRHSAFTLVEVLAALLFLAIVIPTAVEALHMATLSGEVAVRKNAAARVADRILNNSIVTTNWNSGTQNGTVTEGVTDYRWTLTSQTWPQDSMQLLAAEVTYSAQGKDYSVKLSTLASSQAPSGTMNLNK